MLAGSWVSVLLYRRRLLALMGSIFLSYRGRQPSDILVLSHALRTELFSADASPQWQPVSYSVMAYVVMGALGSLAGLFSGLASYS